MKSGVSRTAAIFIGLASLAFAATLSACMNTASNAKVSKNTQYSGSYNPLNSSPAGGSTTFGNYAFTIARVMRNGNNPGTTFDVIGDGSDALGTRCDMSSAASGTTPCVCTFSYTLSGKTEEQSVNTDYVESNLVRCKYNSTAFQLPAAVTTVYVSIRAGSDFSNSVSYSFSGGNANLDLSSALSYAKVKRYQCRDVMTVPYLLGPGADDSKFIYDPFQSEDGRISQALNFYSSNIGGALTAFVGNGEFSKGWECPRDPNATTDYTNLKLFSADADSSGSKLIYPATGSAFDRSTFYLAKESAGVFSVPVNAYLAPNLPTSKTSETALPIGYGASPIELGNNQEVCPDTSVQIPAGYRWVKVWLFRASLPQRTYVRSANFPLVMNIISCSPGIFGYGSDPNMDAAYWLDKKNWVYKDCYDTRGAVADYATTRQHRVISGAGAPANGKCFTANFSSDASSSFLSDSWVATSSVGTPSILNMAFKINGLTHTPFDANLTVGNFDANEAGNRYDYVFVVTPTTVMVSDIENPLSPISKIYTPYRFLSKSDCDDSVVDPENPGAATCDVSRRLLYGFKRNDINEPGDPPAGSGRIVDFPVCALQPI